MEIKYSEGSHCDLPEKKYRYHKYFLWPKTIDYGFERPELFNLTFGVNGIFEKILCSAGS